MALSQTVVWEVQTGGSDTNGGGFDPNVGSPGTDFSQQTSPQITYSDLVIGAGNSATVTSAGNPFTSVHVGNVINITGGGGFTTGWYEVITVSGGVATLDRSVGVVSSTGGTGNLGGCLATPGKANSLMVGGNLCFTKKGTYSISASNGVAGGGLQPPAGISNTVPTIMIGYDINRTVLNSDTGPTLDSGANNSIGAKLSGGFCLLRNFQFTNVGAHTGTIGVQCSAGAQLVEKCNATAVATGFIAQNVVTGIKFINCYAKTCPTIGFQMNNSPPAAVTFVQCVADGCGTSGNAFAGFLLARAGVCIECIAINNLGSGFDTNTNSTADNCVLINCTSYNNNNATFGVGVIADGPNIQCFNVLAYGNQIQDFRDNSNSSPNFISRYTGCAGVNITTASITSSSNLVGFVTLSANPFNNGPANDVSLNNATGGGKSCRAAGYPPTYLGINTNSFFDIGAAQHGQVQYTSVVTATGQAFIPPLAVPQGSTLSIRGVTPVPNQLPGRLVTPTTQVTPTFFPEGGSSYSKYGPLAVANISPGVVVVASTTYPAFFPEPGFVSTMGLDGTGSGVPPIPIVKPGKLVTPVSQLTVYPFPDPGSTFEFSGAVAIGFTARGKLVTPVAQEVPLPFPEPGSTFYVKYGTPPAPQVKPGYVLIASQVIPPFFPEPGSAFEEVGVVSVRIVKTPLPVLAVAPERELPFLPQIMPGSGKFYQPIGIVQVVNVPPNYVVQPKVQATPYPFPPAGSAYYLSVGVTPVPQAPVPPAVYASQRAPHPFPESGSAFNYVSSALPFASHPTTVPVFAVQAWPPGFPEQGSAFYYPRGFVPVPIVLPAPPVLASQRVPYPFPEEGRTYYAGVGVVPVPFVPYTRQFQVVAQELFNPTSLLPGSTFSELGGVVSVAPATPFPPVYAASILPPMLPERGSGIIGKVGVTSVPVVQPGVVVQASQQVPTGFPEPGSTQSYIGVVPVPFVMPPAIVYARETLPAEFPERGRGFSYSIPLPPALVFPGRITFLSDIYAPTVKIAGVVGGG